MSEAAISIPGDRISECISAGSASTLYRTHRQPDGTPVVLKVMNADFDFEAELDTLRDIEEHQV